MKTISVHTAVHMAIDPWGMNGQHTTAMRPTATDVIERLAELGFVVVAHKAHSISIDEGSTEEGPLGSKISYDTWSCSCEADGDDMYDLATHLNELFAYPSEDAISESEQRVLDGNR